MKVRFVFEDFCWDFGIFGIWDLGFGETEGGSFFFFRGEGLGLGRSRGRFRFGEIEGESFFFFFKGFGKDPWDFGIFGRWRGDFGEIGDGGRFRFVFFEGLLFFCGVFLG